MNSPSDAGGATGTQALAAFVAGAGAVSPFEFRSLTLDDAQKSMGLRDSAERDWNGVQQPDAKDGARLRTIGLDRSTREAGILSSIEVARQQGAQAGEHEGRCAGRAEVEVEMNLLVAAERQKVTGAVRQFRAASDRYFAGVEQEVVKLSLAIAERVLHREAQIDPLLLTGVVRVALEKMADRSGVVLRVAGVDVEAWEQVFRSTEASERPRVAEDARLERGECVLESHMGTVELGVHVQLEEIEKGFFDLLNHRPVE